MSQTTHSTGAPGAPAPTRQEAKRIVAEVVTEILPALRPADVGGHLHLKQLGADSVDRVEIILALLDRFGLDLPLSAFADLPNLDAVIDLLLEGGDR